MTASTDPVALSCQAIFRSWFGLTDREADVLTALYLADGDWRTFEQLAGSASVAHLHIHRIRQALEAEALETTARGAKPASYRLTEPGMGECRAVLWTIGEQLRRASIAHRELIGSPFD